MTHASKDITLLDVKDKVVEELATTKCMNHTKSHNETALSVPLWLLTTHIWVCTERGWVTAGLFILFISTGVPGGPLIFRRNRKKFLPPPPPGRDGSATELCQLSVPIREETWEITLKFLSQALLSNALNKKNELKSVRLNKFSKNHTCNSFLNLIRASFCICCASFCTFF